MLYHKIPWCCVRPSNVPLNPNVSAFAFLQWKEGLEALFDS